ncbi:MAG TPA: hypothetical protein VM871_06235 [Flavisolibacter sp.]|nr:hypothetical protein [Flavisolibacter sp.]
MKQKNILARLLLVVFPGSKKTAQSRLVHHSSTTSFLLNRTSVAQNCEGYTYRSVTACIH